METSEERRLIADLDETAHGEEESATIRVVDIRVMREALSRRRLFWVICAILGLGVGGSFHLIVPATYVATTTLYLAQPSSIAPYSIADDVSLLDTTKVAQVALGLLNQTGSRSLPGGYAGAAVGTVLLKIRADGPAPSAAKAWVGALADAFLSVRAKTLNEQSDAEIAALQSQVRAVQLAVNHLDRAVSALSTNRSSSANANQVAQLVSARGADQSQLLNMQDQIEQDQLAQNALVKGSYILDPPLVAIPSKKRIFAEDGLSGLVAGLALGIGLTIVGAVVSGRPRRRADIALVLQAPVLLSIRRRRLGGWRPTRGLGSPVVRRQTRDLRRAQTTVLEYLEPPALSRVALVAVGRASEHAAAVILARCAITLAKSGKRVLLVDLTERGALARTLRARVRSGAHHDLVRAGAHLGLVVNPIGSDVPPLGASSQESDTVLVLANADPAIGARHVEPWAAQSVVVISAGKATDLGIEATGQMLRAAGVSCLGCILLNADRGDETFGASSPHSTAARAKGQLLDIEAQTVDSLPRAPR